MIDAKKSGLVFLGIFLIGLLFIPPSMQPMIPEAAAVAVQDRGDFILHYGPATNYASLDHKVKSWEYFEEQVEWLNDSYKIPYDVAIVVAECSQPVGTLPPDEAVNAYYMPKEYLHEIGYTDAEGRMIVYCYEYMDMQQKIMEALVTPGQGDTIIHSNII